HRDDGADAEVLRGVGDGLTVISGGIGDHPALASGVRQFPNRVVGAANLERAHRLLALELEMGVQLLDIQEPRAARDPAPAQGGGGVLNVRGGDHATFWASGLGIWAWLSPWAPEAATPCRPPLRCPRPRLRLPSRRAPRPPPDRPASGS